MGLEAIQMDGEENRVFHIQLMGCPLSEGTFNFTVKLYTEEERNFELTVTKGDCTFLPDGMVGTEYEEILLALQEVDTYDKVSKTDAPGLELLVRYDEITGNPFLKLMGIPAASGIYVYDIHFVAGDASESTQRFIVTIERDCTILNDALTGNFYTTVLVEGVESPDLMPIELAKGDEVPGMTVTFSKSGTGTSGRLIFSGTPLYAGVYYFSVNYKPAGQHTAEYQTQQFKLTVIKDAIALPTAITHHEYTAKLMDLPGGREQEVDFNWSITTGLEVTRSYNEDFTASELYLKGTPTAKGIFTLTVEYNLVGQDNNTTEVKTKFVISIENGVIDLGNGDFKLYYKARLTADDGNTTANLIEGKLPQGVEIRYGVEGSGPDSPKWIVVEGVPTTGGKFNFTIEFTRGEDKWIQLYFFEICYINGDANGDGVLNTGDAVAVLRHCAELITIDREFKMVADFNRDGFINTADAVAILKSPPAL